MAATSRRRGCSALCPRVVGTTRHGVVRRGYQTKEGSKGNLVFVLAMARCDEVASGDIRSTAAMELPRSSGDKEMGVV